MLRTLTLFFGLALVSIFPAFAAMIETKCDADSHRQPHAQGRLVITEYSFSNQLSNCPTKRFEPNVSLPLSGSSTLYLWFRIQGDAEYLKAHRGGRFLATFNIMIGDRWVWHKDVDMDVLARAQAGKEASGSDGLFDWRVKAERWSLEIPAEYEVRIFHGKTEVCPVSAVPAECAIRFRVEEGL